jgi:hypothetical protein
MLERRGVATGVDACAQGLPFETLIVSEAILWDYFASFIDRPLGLNIQRGHANVRNSLNFVEWKRE